MIKIYLAAAWGRRLEIKELSEKIKKLGFGITSRWLDQEDSGAFAALPNTEAKERFLRQHAVMDVQDVYSADILIRFSDAEEMKQPLVDSRLLSGARNFEMGLAYGLGKKLIVVGGYQNIFDRLANIQHVKDVSALMDLLAGIRFAL